jgi:hypothetical protein
MHLVGFVIRGTECLSNRPAALPGERSTGGFGIGTYVDTLDRRNLLTLPGIEPRLLGLPARRVFTMLVNMCHLVLKIQF